MFIYSKKLVNATQSNQKIWARELVAQPSALNVDETGDIFHMLLKNVTPAN